MSDRIYHQIQTVLPFMMTTPQIASAFGSIVNLYLASMQKIGATHIAVKTTNTFASLSVPYDQIITELQNSTGLNRQRAEVLFETIQSVILDSLQNRKITVSGMMLEHIHARRYILSFTNTAAIQLLKQFVDGDRWSV